MTVTCHDIVPMLFEETETELFLRLLCKNQTLYRQSGVSTEAC